MQVAAGNSLFNVVVETDTAAAILMERLERGNLGRVTFLPLNRLRATEVNYPQSPDVLPMIDRLNFDPLIYKVGSVNSYYNSY